MQLFNDTPFVAQSFEQAGMDGLLNAVVVARGSFVLEFARSKRFRRVDDPRDKNWHDAFDTTGRGTSLITPGDMAPFKHGTDVTVLGTASVAEARSSWPISLQVGQCHKVLRVHGERYWEPVWKGLGRRIFSGWRITEGRPSVSVPLSWDVAFGGKRPAANGQQMHEDNPVGIGILDEDCSPRDQLVPAPQIELENCPISEWRADYKPEGLSPIAPWWRSRQKYAATYDQSWRETRFPLPPLDFDYRFWQTAPADQQVRPWLFGNEVVRLHGFFSSAPKLEFRLPLQKIFCLVRYRGDSFSSNIMFLDGVHLELGQTEIRCRLSWRASFPRTSEVVSSSIALLERKDTSVEERGVVELA